MHLVQVRIIIQVFAHSVVVIVRVSFWVNFEIYYFLGYFNARVVHIVCHWNHAGAVQAIAEATGADLTILVHEQLFGNIFFRKHFGIFPEYSLK